MSVNLGAYPRARHMAARYVFSLRIDGRRVMFSAMWGRLRFALEIFRWALRVKPGDEFGVNCLDDRL